MAASGVIYDEGVDQSTIMSMAAHQLSTLTVIRKGCDVSQEELAAAIDSIQEIVSLWETGARPLPTEKGKAILRFLRRIRGGRAICHGLTPKDLMRPWEEILYERFVKTQTYSITK